MTKLRNTWALREVYFDEDGNPSMHREPVPMTGEQAMAIIRSTPDTMTAIRMTEAQQPAAPEPVAWAYTLEYGSIIADTKVSLQQLRYPFGVCGADYLRVNSDGPSYVRETPLYAAKKEAT